MRQFVFKKSRPVTTALTAWIAIQGAGYSAGAQNTDPGSIGELPYVRYQLCPNNVRRPGNGANGYLYYSKRCTTAYVVPRQEAEFKLQGHPAPGPAVTENWCSLVDDTANDIKAQNTSLRGISEKIGRLEEQMVEADTEKQTLIERKINILKGNSERINKEVAALKKRYDDIEGHSFQVSFATGIDADIEAYRTSNTDTALPGDLDILLPEDRGQSVRFDAAPISNGVLEFVAKEADDVGMKKVLSARIPGLSASGQDEFNINSSYVNANGGMSGKLTLTLGGSCALLKDKGRFSINKPITSESMSAYLVANFTYEVPVQVEYGYEANLKVKAKDLRAEARRVITNGANGLSRTDFMQKFLNGKLKQDFVFRWKSPGPMGTEPKLSSNSGSLPFEVSALVKESMMEKVADRMALLGYIIKRTSKDINIPDVKAGHTTHMRVMRYCTTRKFLGVTYDRSCEDREEYYHIPADGLSVGTDSVADNSEEEFHEIVDIESVTRILHTSTFVPKK